MGALYDEITDPAERKRKLIENGRLVCQQARVGLGGHLDGKQPISVDGLTDLVNSFGYVSQVLRTIGEIDNAQ